MCIQEVREDHQALLQQSQELLEAKESQAQQPTGQQVVSKRHEDSLVTQAAAQPSKLIKVCCHICFQHTQQRLVFMTIDYVLHVKLLTSGMWQLQMS